MNTLTPEKLQRKVAMIGCKKKRLHNPPSPFPSQVLYRRKKSKENNPQGIRRQRTLLAIDPYVWVAVKNKDIQLTFRETEI